jgi:glycosyltransferase involved in cell wall biosynthesis
VRLAVNASFLNERPTGVGVFTSRVAASLASLHEDTYVFASVPIPGVAADHVITVPGAVRGSIRLWHNVSRLVSDNSLIPVLMKARRIDVLFCPITEFPLIGPSRRVVTVHDLHPVYFPEQFGRAADYFRFCLRRLPRAARRVVVLSGFVRDELCRRTDFPAERIDVVGCGYDDRMFRARDEDEKQRFREQLGFPSQYILYVGSLFPYKNVGTLIRAFLSIRHEIPHHLVIAGKREVAREPLPQDDRITYLDYVSYDRLPLLYACADVLVHPSLFEGFGIVVLEAMASGTPVISSDGGSLPEVVGDAGLLFQPKDGAALADLLKRVTGDRVLHASLAGKGLERVKAFSWRQAAARILGCCRKAADAP